MSYFPSIGRFALSSSFYFSSAGANRFLTPVQKQQSGRDELSVPDIPGANRKVSEKGDYDTYECQTCKNRKYQDGSNDPGVSYKMPTNISPERAAYAIRSHEMEHVAHARVKALEEDKEILSQSVSYRTGICPECGRTFMAGGTTQTTFRSAPETYSKESVKKGVYLDLTA